MKRASFARTGIGLCLTALALSHALEQRRIHRSRKRLLALCSSTRQKEAGMQKITPEQGEMVLDLVEQCRVVTFAFEQLECHQVVAKSFQRSSDRKRVAKDVLAKYDKSLLDLADYYADASECGVQDEVLIGVLGDNLPAAVMDIIMTPDAA